MFLLWLFFLTAPQSLQDLSSLTRDWTWALAGEVLSPEHWTTRGFPWSTSFSLPLSSQHCYGVSPVNFQLQNFQLKKKFCFFMTFFIKPWSSCFSLILQTCSALLFWTNVWILLWSLCQMQHLWTFKDRFHEPFFFLTKDHAFSFHCMSCTFVLDTGRHTFRIIVTLDSDSLSGL